MDLKCSGVEEISRYFSHEANNLFFNPKNIAEEQINSKEMKDLDICWIKILSDSNYRYDLRNEASSETGKKLAEIPFIKREMETVCNKKMELIAEKMSCDHRTIQQTFSKLIFYHFLISCNEEESELLCNAMGDSFYRLPLI